MNRNNPALLRSSQKSGQQSFNLVFVYLLAGISLLVAVFLLVEPASAQTNEGQVVEDSENSGSELVEPVNGGEDQSVQSGSQSSTGQSDASQAEQNLIEAADQQAQRDVQEDGTVTYEDLGAKVPAILPDSPLYGFKRFGRGLLKAVTFNQEKKLELEVRFANQELADAQQLLEEKSNDPGVIEEVAKSVERFENSLSKANARAARINSQSADRLVENIVDKQIKHQKVLDNIEKRIVDSNASDQVVDRVVERLANAREKSAEYAAGTISGIEEDSDRLAEHINNALARQTGSDFKDIRNLEILNRLEDHVPEAAKDAIENAAKRARLRFQENILDLPEEDRQLRFERYVNHAEGDEMRHLEVFDKLKNAPLLPEEMRLQFERVKDITAQKFKAHLENIGQQFDDPAVAERFRARALEQFKSGQGVDVGRIRAFDDFQKRVEFEDEKITQEIGRQRDASVDAFIAEIQKVKGENAGAFIDAAGEFRRLSKEIADNPNPTAFRLLEELEAKVHADPEARDILSKIEKEAKQRFVERSEEEGDNFINSVISNNPEDLEIFKKLQQDFRNNPDEFFRPRPFADGDVPPGLGPDGFGPPPFVSESFVPPGFDQVFDKVIRSHSNGVAEYVNSLDDPVLIDNFEKRIDQAPPEILQQIRQNSGDIKRFLEERRDLVDSEENRRFFEESRQRFDNAPFDQQQNFAFPSDDFRADFRSEFDDPPSDFYRQGHQDLPPPPDFRRDGESDTSFENNFEPGRDRFDEPSFDRVRPQEQPIDLPPDGRPDFRSPGSNFRPDEFNDSGRSEFNREDRTGFRPEPGTTGSIGSPGIPPQDEFRPIQPNNNGERFDGIQQPINQAPPPPPSDGGVWTQSVSVLYDRVSGNPVASQSLVLRLISKLFGYERTYAR